MDCSIGLETVALDGVQRLSQWFGLVSNGRSLVMKTLQAFDRPRDMWAWVPPKSPSNRQNRGMVENLFTMEKKDPKWV